MGGTYSMYLVLQHMLDIGVGGTSPKAACHVHFSELGMDWKDVAADKDRWANHKEGWIDRARS